MSIEETRRKLELKLNPHRVHLKDRINVGRKWLELNWDRLVGSDNEETAIKALNKYQRLCDRYFYSYGERYS